MASNKWSYPLIASAIVNIIDGDILLLKDAAHCVDRRLAVRLAGHGGLMVSQGVLALYAARPSASEESKKIAATAIIATDLFMIARIAYMMAKGYDTSNDMLYGPVGALICVVEAGTMLLTLQNKI